MLGLLTLSAHALSASPDGDVSPPSENRFWNELKASLSGWVRGGGSVRVLVHHPGEPVPTVLGDSGLPFQLDDAPLDGGPSASAPAIVAQALVAEPHRMAPGTRIWHFSHVRESALVGPGSSLGHAVYIDAGAIVGAGCKLQNGVNIYRGVIVGDGVFIGPGATFTNDRHPRAAGDWQPEPTFVGEGASIGANATIVCGAHIGRYAMIGAGAVVTTPVPPHALMLGVPARQRGYVCRCGAPARPCDDGTIVCGNGGDCPCQPPLATAT